MSAPLVKKNIVIVGYGAAGSTLTAALAAKRAYNITVVTPFDYQESSVVMTTVVATGAGHDKAIFPLLREDGVEYVIGLCTEVRESDVVVNSGERTLPFDACVICTGQAIPVFLPNAEVDTTPDARRATVAAAHDSIARANNIVIAGGGAVGIEVAADIKLRNPGKKVTVVHSHGTVLQTMSPQFPPLVTRFLEGKGVEFVLGEKVVEHSNGQVTLASGKKLDCDYYIPANASGGVSKFMPRGSVDARGYIKVDDTFRVEGLSKVLAHGDV